jgi:hypothetical protein
MKLGLGFELQAAGVVVCAAPAVGLVWCWEKIHPVVQSDGQSDGYGYLVLVLILSLLMLPLTGWIAIPLFGLGTLIARVEKFCATRKKGKGGHDV